MLGGLLAIVAAGLGASWFVAGRLIAPARSKVVRPTDLPLSDVAFDSASGARIAGWHGPVDGATACVILAHGIYGDRTAMLDRARLLHAAGYDVLLFDLQAHGESGGEAITIGHRERLDLQAAVDWVRKRTPGRRIAVIGRSLGGAAAVLGSPLGIDALVLEAVYPTIESAVANRLAQRLGPLGPPLAPLLLLQLEPRLGVALSDLRPIDRLPDCGCPVLLCTGDQDRHTTLAETKAMLAAAPEPKELVIFPGAAHVNLFEADPERYREHVLAFLRRHLSR